MRANELKYKVWYRILKVIYVGLYAILLLLVISISYASKPYLSIDYKRSMLMCDNHDIYVLGDTYLFPNDSGNLDYLTEQNMARSICAHGIAARYNFGNAPTYKNYSISIQHKTEGSWRSVVENVLISSVIISIIMEVIRRVALYILVGPEVKHTHAKQKEE